MIGNIEGSCYTFVEAQRGATCRQGGDYFSFIFNPFAGWQSQVVCDSANNMRAEVHQIVGADGVHRKVADVCIPVDAQFHRIIPEGHGTVEGAENVADLDRMYCPEGATADLEQNKCIDIEAAAEIVNGLTAEEIAARFEMVETAVHDE